ncbi:MAG: serine hydroxymethyltransferase [Candidatus Hermodarchaeota archaeon]|nr:serine hydroxymethyltransferase [Candidatus Hermodarchaeota archaeon]
MKPSEAQSTYNEIFTLLEKHHSWMRDTVNLIASENVHSPAVREAMQVDFSDRYAEGWPGERVYAGTKYIDEVEILGNELTKTLFRADFADVRPISGVLANLSILTAFTEPGDRMMCLSIPTGGHISSARHRLWGTAGRVRGLKIQYFKYDEYELNIDVDATIRKIERLKKKGKHIDFYMFGASVFPFPHPISEIAEVAKGYGAYVNHDAAHVAGLVAANIFQDPLREGANSLTFSTHKTLPGPQGGCIVAHEEFADRIKRGVFPALHSNHHLHHVAAKAVAMAEMIAFGKEYSKQIIKNAQALGSALMEEGFKVLAEHKGFTKSHVLLIEVANSPLQNGRAVEETLEEANIIINRNLLPWDKRFGRDYIRPGGIRLGTSEVTRLGMKEEEMSQIAEFMRKIVFDQKSPKLVAKEVAQFRKKFQKVHYAFDTARDAYDYVKLR